MVELKIMRSTVFSRHLNKYGDYPKCYVCDKIIMPNTRYTKGVGMNPRRCKKCAIAKGQVDEDEDNKTQ